MYDAGSVSACLGSGVASNQAGLFTRSVRQGHSISGQEDGGYITSFINSSVHSVIS